MSQDTLLVPIFKATDAIMQISIARDGLEWRETTYEAKKAMKTIFLLDMMDVHRLFLFPLRRSSRSAACLVAGASMSDDDMLLMILSIPYNV